MLSNLVHFRQTSGRPLADFLGTPSGRPLADFLGTLSGRPLADFLGTLAANLRQVRSLRTFHHLRHPRGALLRPPRVCFSASTGLSAFVFSGLLIFLAADFERLCVDSGFFNFINLYCSCVDCGFINFSYFPSDFNSSGTGAFVLQSLASSSTGSSSRAPCYTCHPGMLRTRPSVAMFPPR